MDLLKRCFLCFARLNPENLFFSEDNDIVILLLTLYSFTNNGWSLQLLEEDLAAVIFVSNTFMSSCVIAREIFLFQSNCSSITKVYHFFAVELTL